MQNVASVGTCAEIAAALSHRRVRRLSLVSTTLDFPLLELQSDSGEMFAVENPATGETVAEVPRMGEAETRRALQAAEDALPLALTAREGTRADPAPVGRPDARERRAARPAPHDRAGQAAGRVAGRDRVRRIVPRVVRRGGKAGLRRHDPHVHARPADRRHQGAGGRNGGDHSVELPGRDGHAQGGAGARRRLHDGAEARRADAALGARGREARPKRPACRRAFSASSPAAPRMRRSSAAS